MYVVQLVERLKRNQIFLLICRILRIQNMENDRLIYMQMRDLIPSGLYFWLNFIEYKNSWLSTRLLSSAFTKKIRCLVLSSLIAILSSSQRVKKDRLSSVWETKSSLSPYVIVKLASSISFLIITFILAPVFRCTVTLELSSKQTFTFSNSI